MARPRRSKRRWASRSRGLPHSNYAVDSASNVLVPNAGTVGDDPFFAGVDYALATGPINEQVRVERLSLDLHWNAQSYDTTFGAFVVEFAIVASLPDAMNAFVLSGASIGICRTLGMRVIQETLVRFEEPGASNVTPHRPPSWKVRLRTHFKLKEPETLYLLQRPVVVQGSMGTYEYSYTARTFFRKVG